MIEENICDGDLVICEYCQRVPNGTIIVALINGQEATLKRIYYERLLATYICIFFKFKIFYRMLSLKFISFFTGLYDNGITY